MKYLCGVAALATAAAAILTAMEGIWVVSGLFVASNFFYVMGMLAWIAEEA